MHNILLSIFPDFKKGDWTLQDDSDGNGPYIKLWNRPEPKPTAAEIDAARPAAEDKESKEKANAPILTALAASDPKILRAMEEGDAVRIADLKAIRVALRAQLLK
jgi:hypothetical protein